VKAKTVFFTVYAITLAGAFAWLGAVVLAPYLARGSSPAAGFLYALFSPVCHQIPSRCFHLFGHPMAVCSRCFGIYSGFLGGLLAYPLLRGFGPSPLPRSRTLFLLSTPIIVDAAANMAGLWSSSGGARFVTGFLWGILLPFYFLAGIIDYLSRRSPKKQAEITQVRKN